MSRDARTVILDTLWARLEDGGDSAFSFAELAQAAGVSRQTVYSYFPDRPALFVALADHARAALDAAGMRANVLEAATARDALDALVEFHMRFTVRLLRTYRAVELEQARDPAVAAAFAQRPSGREQVVRAVVTRLRAEGDLDPSWTVASATDAVSVLLAATVSAELLLSRRWTAKRLAERLRFALRRLLLPADPTDPTNPIDTGGLDDRS